MSFIPAVGPDGQPARFTMLPTVIVLALLALLVATDEDEDASPGEAEAPLPGPATPFAHHNHE